MTFRRICAIFTQGYCPTSTACTSTFILPANLHALGELGIVNAESISLATYVPGVSMTSLLSSVTATPVASRTQSRVR